jgi:hypothetical protein
VGDPGLPLAQAVDEVEAWYQARALPPMIVIPGPLGTTAPDGGQAGDPLDATITRALATEGARQGADRVFLQVEEDNAAARVMYARCGFAAAHRYHYRVAPEGPP